MKLAMSSFDADANLSIGMSVCPITDWSHFGEGSFRIFGLSAMGETTKSEGWNKWSITFKSVPVDITCDILSESSVITCDVTLGSDAMESLFFDV